MSGPVSHRLHLFALVVGSLLVASCSGDPAKGPGKTSPDAGTNLDAGVEVTETDAGETTTGDVDAGDIETDAGEVTVATPDPLGEHGGAIIGRVRDQTRVALAGVSIRMGSRTAAQPSAVTNAAGNFVVSPVAPAKRVPVFVDHPGYAPTVKYVDVEEGDIATVDVILTKLGTTHHVDAASGGSITEGGVKVTFPAGALDAPAGKTVDVRLAFLEPTDEGIEAGPGDLRAVDEGGDIAPLESFGMIFIDTTLDDLPIALHTGKTVQIELPLPVGSNPGATVPFWVFDEERGVWVQMGTGAVRELTVDATRLGFNFEVPYTRRWWNCDMMRRLTCIQGKVTDCAGNAIPGVLIRAVGSRGTTEAATGGDGRYYVWPVLKSSTVRIEARVRIGERYFVNQIESHQTSGGDNCSVAPTIEIGLPNQIVETSMHQQKVITEDGDVLESTYAGASFYSTPLETGVCAPSTMDECTVVKFDTVVGPEVPLPDLHTVSAGLVQLLGPPNVTLAKSEDLVDPTYTWRQDGVLMPSGGDLMLSITGSGPMEPYRIRRAIRVPPIPTISAPAARATLSRGSGLALTWTPTSKPGSLRIFVMPSAPSETDKGVLCTPEDTGQFTIPAAFATQIRAGTANLTFIRTWERWHPTPDGMVGDSSGSSSVSQPLTLQ